MLNDLTTRRLFLQKGLTLLAAAQTIPLFLRRRMNCPGCPMVPFMTAAEAAPA